MANLTKREIVLRSTGRRISAKTDRRHCQQTLDIIQKALADGRNVELRNFGVLEVQVRKQRIGRNPTSPKRRSSSAACGGEVQVGEDSQTAVEEDRLG